MDEYRSLSKEEHKSSIQDRRTLEDDQENSNLTISEIYGRQKLVEKLNYSHVIVSETKKLAEEPFIISTNSTIKMKEV